MRAELSYAGAAYEGKLNDARTEMEGEWQQGGGAVPLTLRKSGAGGAELFPEASPDDVGIPARALPGPITVVMWT